MKWISVKDRLPEMNQLVLICHSIPKEKVNFGRIVVASRKTGKFMSDGSGVDWYPDVSCRSFWSPVGGISPEDVQWWMPLPKEPKIIT